MSWLSGSAKQASTDLTSMVTVKHKASKPVDLTSVLSKVKPCPSLALAFKAGALLWHWRWKNPTL